MIDVWRSYRFFPTYFNRTETDIITNNGREVQAKGVNNSWSVTVQGQGPVYAAQLDNEAGREFISW